MRIFIFIVPILFLIFGCYRPEVTTPPRNKNVSQCLNGTTSYQAFNQRIFSDIEQISSNQYEIVLSEQAQFFHLSWHSSSSFPESEDLVVILENSTRLSLQKADHHDHGETSFSHTESFSFESSETINSFNLILPANYLISGLKIEAMAKPQTSLMLTQKSDFKPEGYQSYPSDFRIISRREWAAGQFTFPQVSQDFTKVERIVVHHTAALFSNGEDCGFKVRSIYKHHTDSNGWNDIGYQFLVCPNGQVFEGRGGGKGIVGAHAFGSNYGTLAISVIGNYEESGGASNALSPEAEESITSLIAWLAFEHEINLVNPDIYTFPNRTNVLIPAVTWHNFMTANASLNRSTTNCAGSQLIRDHLENGSIAQKANQKLQELGRTPPKLEPSTGDSDRESNGNSDSEDAAPRC